MLSLLKKLFLENWLRKLIALILAIIVWLVIDSTMTTTRSIESVGVRIINLPKNHTVSGLQPTGLLSKRISLSVTGKKLYIDQLGSTDFEICIDAREAMYEPVITLHKRHLVSQNPSLSIRHHINHIRPRNLFVRLVPLAEEQLPVYVSRPIGKPPRGYKFLEIWPYHLNLTVRGPEETINRLKKRGLKLTFNLNDIPKSTLEQSSSKKRKSLVSYYIPEEWKMMHIPSISDKPLQIDDPDAKLLRIDFIREKNIPINASIPVQLFIAPNENARLNAALLSVANTELIKEQKGVKILNKTVYTQDVSDLFVKLIQKNLYLSINLTSNDSPTPTITWSLQLINPQTVEDEYVTAITRDYIDDDIRDLRPAQREEYLRNRFRNYMNRFQLYKEDGTKLKLNIQLSGKQITLHEETP